MALLPKKYLRIHDVAEYLNNLNAGYEYDLSESYDRNKLNDDIYDLVVHGELKAVFKHFTENFTQAYFIVYDKELSAILRFNSWQDMSDSYLIYSYMNGQKPEQDKFVKIINDGVLNFDDIYIPKEELDVLFNSNDDSVKQIYSLQAKNDDLNARLCTARNSYTQHQNEIKALKEKSNQADIEKSELIEQLSKIKAELADKLANDYDHLDDRTEKSYLITIGLLLELMTSPKGIDSKKPFSSQAIIISGIAEKGIYGQGTSTLEGRFGDANDILIDVKKK